MSDVLAHNAHHLVLTNFKYLNAPAGDELIHLHLLEDVVCIIGAKYGQIKASKKKKGIAYLAREVGCAKRQIKLMLKSVPAPVIRESNASKYIFRCHIKNYTTIYEKILALLATLDGTDFQDRIMSVVRNLPPDQRCYRYAFINKPLIGLGIIESTGSSSHKRNMAHSMIERVKEHDSEHPIAGGCPHDP